MYLFHSMMVHLYCQLDLITWETHLWVCLWRLLRCLTEEGRRALNVGWDHHMDWGIGLSEKEKVSLILASIPLCFLMADVMWAASRHDFPTTIGSTTNRQTKKRTLLKLLLSAISSQSCESHTPNIPLNMLSCENFLSVLDIFGVNSSTFKNIVISL